MQKSLILGFRSVFLTPIIFCLLMLVCSSSADAQSKITKPRPQSPVSETSDQLNQLRSELFHLQDRITNLESRLSLQEVLLKNKQQKQDEIYLNPSDHSFQRLDADTGFFLVSVEDVVPYLNGYKIHLSLGNPSSASYAGYKLKIRWSKAYDFSKYTAASYAEWEKGIQEKEISYTERLESGAWNPAEVIVTPASADQFAYLVLSISTPTVSLRQRPIP